MITTIFTVIAVGWLGFAIAGLLVSFAVWAAIRLAAGPTLMGSPVSWTPPRNVLSASVLFGPFTWVIAGIAQLFR